MRAQPPPPRYGRLAGRGRPIEQRARTSRGGPAPKTAKRPHGAKRRPHAAKRKTTALQPVPNIPPGPSNPTSHILSNDRRPTRHTPSSKPMQIGPHGPGIERSEPGGEQRPAEPGQHVTTPRGGQPGGTCGIDPSQAPGTLPRPPATKVVDPFKSTVAENRSANSRTAASRSASTSSRATPNNAAASPA